MGSRLLFLRGSINEENTGEIIEQILNINLSDDSANLVGELEQNREPIHLHIQSNGGAVLDALTLIDIMKNSKTPIYTYADGYVYSAAVYIFVVGSKRFVNKHSWLLIHNMKTKLGNYTTQNISDNLEWLNALEKQTADILLENTKISQKQLQKINTNNLEYLFDSEQAIQDGVADEIL